jgi:hypothetical protein
LGSVSKGNQAVPFLISLEPGLSIDIPVKGNAIIVKQILSQQKKWVFAHWTPELCSEFLSNPLQCTASEQPSN